MAASPILPPSAATSPRAEAPSPTPQGAALKGWAWWQTEPGATGQQQGGGREEKGRPQERCGRNSGSRQLEGRSRQVGPPSARRQEARALGRTAPASGGPEMSFRTEGQALSPVTRGAGQWLSHGSLCLRACGNRLLSSGSLWLWIGAPPSATIADLSAAWDADQECGWEHGPRTPLVCITKCPLCARLCASTEGRATASIYKPDLLYSFYSFLSDPSVPFVIRGKTLG